MFQTNRQEIKSSAPIEVVAITLTQKLIRMFGREKTSRKFSVVPLSGKHLVLPPYCLAERDEMTRTLVEQMLGKRIHTEEGKAFF